MTKTPPKWEAENSRLVVLASERQQEIDKLHASIKSAIKELQHHNEQAALATLKPGLKIILFGRRHHR